MEKDRLPVEELYFRHKYLRAIILIEEAYNFHSNLSKIRSSARTAGQDLGFFQQDASSSIIRQLSDLESSYGPIQGFARQTALLKLREKKFEDLEKIVKSASIIIDPHLVAAGLDPLDQNMSLIDFISEWVPNAIYDTSVHVWGEPKPDNVVMVDMDSTDYFERFISKTMQEVHTLRRKLHEKLEIIRDTKQNWYPNKFRLQDIYGYMDADIGGPDIDGTNHIYNGLRAPVTFWRFIKNFRKYHETINPRSDENVFPYTKTSQSLFKYTKTIDAESLGDFTLVPEDTKEFFSKYLGLNYRKHLVIN